MDELVSWRDEQNIRMLLARYGRAIDRHDLGALQELFHADAVIHYGPDVFEGPVADGLPALIAMARTMLRSQHLLGQSVIELRGARAWAETYGQAMHILPGPSGPLSFVSGNRYLDTLDRRDDGWRISRRQVVVDWLSEGPADEHLFERLAGPPRGGPGAVDPSTAFWAQVPSPTR